LTLECKNDKTKLSSYVRKLAERVSSVLAVQRTLYEPFRDIRGSREFRLDRQQSMEAARVDLQESA
jgi:hypothetical protein